MWLWPFAFCIVSHTLDISRCLSSTVLSKKNTKCLSLREHKARCSLSLTNCKYVGLLRTNDLWWISSSWQRGESTGSLLTITHQNYTAEKWRHSKTTSTDRELQWCTARKGSISYILNRFCTVKPLVGGMQKRNRQIREIHTPHTVAILCWCCNTVLGLLCI